MPVAEQPHGDEALRCSKLKLLPRRHPRDTESGKGTLTKTGLTTSRDNDRPAADRIYREILRVVKRF